MNKSKKLIYIFSISPIPIILISFCTFYFGVTKIELNDLIQAFTEFDHNNITHQIIMTERLPRIIAVIIAGGMLALAGTMMQAITRNYLASPSLMGVNDGAQLMITLALIFIPHLTNMILIIFSISGSFLALSIIFIISIVIKHKLTPVSMAILGLVIGAFFNAIAVVLALYFKLSQNIMTWYNTKIFSIDIPLLKVTIILALILFIISYLASHQLNILTLSSEVAVGLGQNTTKIYILFTLLVVIMSGLTTALVGNIGFVGLVIPHITRMLIGRDYRWTIPFNIVLGACFLLLCDFLSKWINYPFETPISIPTGLIGVPFFLYLIRKRGNENAI